MGRGVKPWIGLDGEGIGRNPHRYTLLARADIKGHGGYIEDLNGLSSKKCFDFLLRIPDDVRVCGYYLGYDWTKILQDLPDEAIYRLLRPELRSLPKDEGGGFSYILWRGYRLHYLAGMFRVGRGNRKTTIWDIGKFYQSPFVDAIETWEVDAPLADIKRMKDSRSEFTSDNHLEVRNYCIFECQALADLATRLEAAHDAVDIVPNTWYGPGSTAGALMHSLGIADKRGEHLDALAYAADCAFFGGRFEHSSIGRFEKVYGNDIVSAYPYQAFRLPCLEHGKWKRVSREREIAGGIHACVRYTISDIGHKEVWAPLPCRLRSGTIVFPRGGSTGWVWLDEYLAAIKHWKGVKFGGEAWVLHQECDCKPFESLLPLFRERVLLGKSGRGRILKLALNSVYGKLAQCVGNPRFASRIWAGMITSGTRAQLLVLMVAHSSRADVIALATDGLYSLSAPILPRPPLMPDLLGSWERDEPKSMIFVRPGIYWADEGKTVRVRGLSRKLLDRNTEDKARQERVLAQREAVLDAIEADDKRVIIGESELFGGARACVYKLPDGTIKRSKHYGEWRKIPARVSLDARPKRNSDWSLHMLTGVESYPYSKAPLSDDAKALKVIGEMFWGMQ